MAADGLTALDTLNWGTSTGGAVGSAETTSTLGQDRKDVQTPVDQYHLWNQQISQCKNLLLNMTSYFKGGTRLQVLPQSSNPFGVSEVGFYVDNSGNPKLSYLGAVSGLGGGGSTGNWTFSGNIADLTGAGALQLGGGTATSVKLLPATLNFPSAMSMAATAQGATNTTGLTIQPDVADGASSVGLAVNANTALSTSGAQIATFSTAGSLKSAINNLGTYNNGGAGFRPGATSYWDASYANPKYAFTSGSFAPFGDNQSTSGAAGAMWSQSYSYAYMTKSQANTVGATFTINPANGSYVKQTLTSATNVTAVTISAGTDGQEIVVEIIQPAAGTADTVATTWTNVAFAGGVGVFTNTLGKRDIYTFIYNATTSKWNETGRAVNVS